MGSPFRARLMSVGAEGAGPGCCANRMRAAAAQAAVGERDQALTADSLSCVALVAQQLVRGSKDGLRGQ